jgi:cell division protein FtsI/penicillin-binding protein 2
MNRRRTAVLAAGLMIISLGACSAKSKNSSPDGAVAAFLAGWQAHNFAGSVKVVDDKGTAIPNATVTADITKLSGDLSKITPTLSGGKPAIKGDTAAEPITVSWPVNKTTTWKYDSSMSLKKSGSAWQIVWSPSIIHPQLTAIDSFILKAKKPDRGAVLDGDGNPIVTARPVVDIGIVPGEVKDVSSEVATIQTAFDSQKLGISLKDLPKQMAAAGPKDYVYIATIRRDPYEAIKSQIYDLPGTRFSGYNLDLAPTRVFARALLGTVDDVTKEVMDKNPGKYQIGDKIGYGGIEGQYEARLAGTPGLVISIPGHKADDGTTNADTELFNVDPTPGQPVKTTINQQYQNAADKAIANASRPTAFVAIRISDGAVLAVANGPGASGLDLALTAQVPPGSTFKMVTAAAVLDNGSEHPGDHINCPKELTVDGRTFTNFGGEVLGDVTFTEDFAQSCNTAFASLYTKMGPNGLHDMATKLGIGQKWSLGVDTFTGSAPAGGSNVDQAAAAFGQGKTLVSPMAMAAAAAAVARGHWIAPSIVLDPPVTGNAAPGPQLKASTLDDLKTLMRAVVTSGTGKKVLNVPGGPVFGKTGTAEHDGGADHSWFVGYQGDVAFAMFVDSGGVSTGAAVPLTANFFNNLH